MQGKIYHYAEVPRFRAPKLSRQIIYIFPSHCCEGKLKFRFTLIINCVLSATHFKSIIFFYYTAVTHHKDSIDDEFILSNNKLTEMHRDVLLLCLSPPSSTLPVPCIPIVLVHHFSCHQFGLLVRNIHFHSSLFQPPGTFVLVLFYTILTL